MSISNKSKLGESLCFGPFCLNTTTRTLLKNSEPVPLGGRAFDLLMAFVINAGVVLSRRDLMEMAWPDVIVEEANLRVQIANLRKFLGQQANGAPYIVTVPARGYSFVAPMQRALDVAKTPDRPSGTRKLPARLPRMVGRKETIDELVPLVLSRRFVSIVSSGGIGKTTVAIALGNALLHEFAEAVYFIDLGSINDPSLVCSAVASAIGSPGYEQDPLSGLISFLSNRKQLLIFDNCEHVIEPVTKVCERIFNDAPQTYIVTTSRELLRLEGEHVHLLPPLDTPRDGADVSTSEILASPSVQLFMERASASGYRPGLNDSDTYMIAEICRKLDGVPLAIELVASRSGIYGIGQTEKLLEDRLKLLWQGRRDSPPRHQTLQAMIDWSYGLLSEQDKDSLRRLSIFAGYFTLKSAFHVTAASGPDEQLTAESIASLASKSLICVSNIDGETYYRLLDTTRTYAAGKLAESGAFEAVARSHAAHYARHLAQCEVRSVGSPDISAQAVHMDNIRSALAWAFADNGDIEIGIEIAFRAAPLFLSLSCLDECARWCKHSLQMLPETKRGTEVELALQESLAISSMFTRGNSSEVREAIDRGLALAVSLDDCRYERRLLAELNIFLVRTGDFRSALDVAERTMAIAEKTGILRSMVIAEWMLGVAHHLIGNQMVAQWHCERGLSLANQSRETSFDILGYDHRVRALVALARALWLRGFPQRALAVAHQAIAEADSRSQPVTTCIAHIYTIPIFLWVGDFDRAARNIEILIASAGKSTLEPYRAVGVALKGELMIARGDLVEGVELLRTAIAQFKSGHHHVLTAAFSRVLAEALAETGQFDDALTIIAAEIESMEQFGDNFHSPDVMRAHGTILLAASSLNPENAEDILMRAIDLAREQSALVWELRATIPLALIWKQQGRVEQARDILGAVVSQFDWCSAADLQRARILLDKLNDILTTDSPCTGA